jgi:hypothetical protein
MLGLSKDRTAQVENLRYHTRRELNLLHLTAASTQRTIGADT